MTEAQNTTVYIALWNEKPILADNPLMVAPWRDELEDYIEANEPALHSFITTGLYMDTSGGNIIFSSLQQATDYYQGTMPTGFSYKNPAKAVYTRPASVTAAYAAARPPITDITRADLEKRHTVSPAHACYRRCVSSFDYHLWNRRLEVYAKNIQDQGFRRRAGASQMVGHPHCEFGG